MVRWHGKHPGPWDFFYTFNDAAKKNMDWFWNNWFFSNNYIDYAVKSVVKKGNSYSVAIDNIGGMAAPVNIIATYDDGSNESFHQTPAIWEKDQRQAIVTINAKKKVTSLRLNGGIFMDADESNNSFKAN